MPAELAAKRYAQAAFEIAAEQGMLDAWSEALKQVASFMSEPDYARLLENTRVALEVKHRLIDAGIRDQPQFVQNLAHLLVNKSRTALAGDIAAHFAELVQDRQGIARAHVTTAVAMSDAEREALTLKLQQATGNRILMETSVEPEILGGVIVQIGDRLFDGSTRARLSALRHDLVGAVG